MKYTKSHSRDKFDIYLAINHYSYFELRLLRILNKTHLQLMIDFEVSQMVQIIKDINNIDL